MSKRMTMVERVARAICKADKLAPDADAPIMIGKRRAVAWEGRIEMARAAIRALHEPTIQMVDAGDSAMSDVKDGGWDSGSDGESYNSYEYIIAGGQTVIYQRMLAAALDDRDSS